MTGRARTVLTGLAALAGLAALDAGLPLVRYRFGGAHLAYELAKGSACLTGSQTGQMTGEWITSPVSDSPRCGGRAGEYMRRDGYATRMGRAEAAAHGA